MRPLLYICGPYTGRDRKAIRARSLTTRLSIPWYPRGSSSGITVCRASRSAAAAAFRSKSRARKRSVTAYGGRMWNGGCCGETWGGAPGPPPGDSKFR